MLFDGRSLAHLAQLLDIARHVHRPHVLDAPDAFVLALAQERTGSHAVCPPSVSVTNIDREEFNEAPGGMLTGHGNGIAELSNDRPCVATNSVMPSQFYGA